MRTKLTKRTVDSAPVPNAGRKDIIIRDTELVGFGLRVTAAGSRVYFAEPRRNGQRRRVVIGRHGNLTAEQARAKAKELLAQTTLGEDIAEARQRSRSLPTMAELLDAYLDRYATAAKKPRTVEEDRRMVKLHILPSFGTKRAVDVTGEDVAALKRRMAETPVRFNACRALLSHAFNLALRGEHGPLGGGWGVTANPCAFITKNRTERRERFLSSPEFAALGAALATAEAAGTERPPIVAAIRLLALTGARRDEIRTCRWEYVDFEHGCLRLPHSKTGAKVLPLPGAALKILRALRRANPFSPWVIPGTAAGTCATDLEHPWQRVRKAAGLEAVRLHDLRHSHASVAVVGGVPLRVVGAILGHRNTATTERYAHVGADPIREGTERVGAIIAAKLAASR